MALPLLKTKLHVPRPPANFVPRPGLLKILDAGLPGSVALISAPAGYGKTTLLSDWVQKSGAQAAWISLDAADSDFKQFLRYLIEALQTSGLDLEEESLTALITPESVEVEGIAAHILNSLLRHQDQITLILDDYHLIDNPTIHQFIRMVIENLPESLSLVLSTRADPPLPFARLRADGNLTEIRADDLGFDSISLKAFLNDIYGLDLSSGALDQILDRTEGWPAGIQLLSFVLMNTDHDPDFIAKFSGDHAYIAEYLGDEVFQGLPAAELDFLLRTAFLERFTASLCDKVRGANDSNSLLGKLESRNLFLVALDEEKQWFRYHHLFAELLQKRARERDTDELIRERNKRASEWFEAHGLFIDAVEYALQSEDVERALTLVEQQVEHLMRGGEHYLFQSWMSSLPLDEIIRRPEVAIYYAWIVLIKGGEKKIPQRILSEIDPKLPAIQGRLEAVGAVKAILLDHDPVRAEALARNALDRLDSDDGFFRNMTMLHLSATYYLQGKLEQGFQTLNKAVELGRSSENLMLTVTALSRLGFVDLHAGRLMEAEQRFYDAIHQLDIVGSKYHPLGLTARIGLAKIYFAWNDLNGARKHLEIVLERENALPVSHAIDAYDTYAFIIQASEDYESAVSYLNKASSLSSQTRDTKLDDRYIACRKALLAIKQGELDSAIIWAHGHGLAHDEPGERSVSIGTDIIQSYERYVYARLLFEERRPGDAVNALAGLDADVHDQLSVEMQLEAELLRFLALRSLQQPDNADEALIHALEIGQTGQFIRPFLEAGHPVERALSRLEHPEKLELYRARLLRLFKDRENEAGTGSSARLIEALTQREREVLEILATELTVPEIASSLNVAESTIRSHVKNIYGKLDAHSRFEAVSRARDRGLI